MKKFHPLTTNNFCPIRKNCSSLRSILPSKVEYKRGFGVRLDQAPASKAGGLALSSLIGEDAPPLP